MTRILLEAFQRSDAFGRLILLLLAGMSLRSWAIILGELLRMRQAERAGEVFREDFQARPDPLELHGSGAPNPAMEGPLWRVYAAGCNRAKGLLRRARAEGWRRLGTKEVLDVEDAMTLAIGHESLQLEMRLWTLGTIASVSPLMGLFGTVWGIMVCFHDMGVLGTTSIRAVAPGLTVALVTTAFGLAVAIPAMVGNNVLSSRMRLSVNAMKSFAMDFLYALERSAEDEERPRASAAQ